MHACVHLPVRSRRALAPKMAEKGSGWIINVGDVEAIHEGPHHAAYAASKVGRQQRVGS